MNKWIAALAIALCGAMASAQTTIEMSLDDARALAMRAFLAGEEATAIQIARGLLQADPDDRAALIIVAAAAPGQGNPDEGRRAGARAWTVSQTDLQKYEAARLTALAAAREERYALAMFWLRRALTVAPNDAEIARTTQDAARLRRVNPWSTTFSLSVVPSNNINGGAEDETLTAPGLPDGTLSPDALALAGVRATAQLRTQYRLAETRKSRTTVALSYQASRVRLDSDAQGNGISGSEFATDAADITLGYDRALENGSVSGRLTFGTFDFGGEDYYDFRRIAIGRTVPVGTGTSLQFYATREVQTYAATSIGEVDRVQLRGTVTHKLPGGDVISGGLGYLTSDAASVNYTFNDWSLQGSYTWADPFGPVSLGISGGVKWTDYPNYNVIFPVDGGREDLSLFYGVNIGFSDATYAGFTPALAINGSVSDSNISRFTRNTVSVALTLNSSF